MPNQPNNLIAQWTKAGVLFNTTPSAQSPDLERLLLETARQSPTNARLFIMAVTWLSHYSVLIAKHRLRHLIIHELEAEHQPTMGLMLELALEAGACEGLKKSIAQCNSSQTPGPLFHVMRKNPTLEKLAQTRASEASRRWGRWTQPFELKYDALRPARWIAENNPEYRLRAAHRGDMRSTILETLKRDETDRKVISEAQLSRACSAHRAGVRSALDGLELEGLIERKAVGRSKRISLKRSVFCSVKKELDTRRQDASRV